MEQLVKEETQKRLANQTREARIQRQKQVRQQAMAWTEATRRKFEETKEREIKGLANAVTGQVQSAAIQNIEQLTIQNDLAMAEIGMAHRAAAGFQNVERLKSLKRLKNEEVANNRGSAAMMRHMKQKQAEKSKSTAILKRKEEVRKAEDRLSKDLISRRPLTVTNSNTEPKEKLGPPEYQPSIAKTLRVAHTGERNQRKESTRPNLGSNAKAKLKPKRLSEKKTGPLASSSSDLALRKKKQEIPKERALDKMVRIKMSSPSKAGLNFESEGTEKDYSKVKDLYGIGYKLRNKYMTAARGVEPHVPTPIQSKVRYFDATIPKGEVKYVAPKGLAVKESRTSPDAWEKGRKTSEESLQQQRNKMLKEQKITQKVAERGKMAMKKAKLEKEILDVRNELLEEIDFQFLGTGSQKAILGLEDNEDEIEEADAFQTLHQNLSSDEFSAVDSDEEFTFPSPTRTTLKKYDVIHDKSKDQDILTLKPTSSSVGPIAKIKSSSSTDSFDSYSPPSLHSLEDEGGTNEKPAVSLPLSPATLADNLEKVKEESKRPSGRFSADDPHLSTERSTLASIVDSLVSHTGKDSKDQPISVAGHQPINMDTVEGKGGRKTSSPRVPEKKSKRKKSISKSAQQSKDRISRPGSLYELVDLVSVNKDKDSLTSIGSYSPPSMHSSKDEISKKGETKQRPVVQSLDKPKAKGDILNSASEGKNKNQDNENISKNKISGRSTLAQIVDSMVSQRETDDVPSREASKKSISKRKSSSLEKANTPSTKSLSSSTIAEVNVRTRSGDVTAPDRESSPLQDVLDKARQQEQLLLTGSSSLSDLQEDSKPSGKKGSRSSPVTIASKSAKQSRASPKEKKESSSGTPSQSNLSSSLTDSDPSSALVNIKIKKQLTSSTPSHSSNDSRASGHTHSNSDESSALLNLKVLEDSGNTSTPSRSENSTSETTDYYSPPDGPFTSTPDGKLHAKSTQRKSSDGGKSVDDLKRRTFHHYVNKFMKRRPDSIEKLPVSSSSSSIIRADSDVLESDSFGNVNDGISQEHNDTHSTTKSDKSSSYSSSASKKGLSTLREEIGDDDSGSTIAETAIVAGRIVSINTTTTSTTSSNGKNDSSNIHDKSSSDDIEPVSSDSLTGLLRALSTHQEIEKRQLEHEDEEINYSHELEQSSVRTSGNNQSNALLDSSRDSIPDASAILRRLMSRQTARNSSRSSASSSPKSGPEKEAKRVELLDDVTPTKLWETPPRANVSGANDTEKLSAVFEKLIDKWSNMRIEKPPWTPPEDSTTQNEGK